MTVESSSNETFNSDNHDEETKKSYYHTFDDETVEKMKGYFKVKKRDDGTLMKYLKDNKVPGTTPDDV